MHKVAEQSSATENRVHNQETVRLSDCSFTMASIEACTIVQMFAVYPIPPHAVQTIPEGLKITFQLQALVVDIFYASQGFG